VTCIAKDIGTLLLSKQILPADIAPLSKIRERTGYEKDPSVYESASYYPDTWYRSEFGAGRIRMMCKLRLSSGVLSCPILTVEWRGYVC